MCAASATNGCFLASTASVGRTVENNAAKLPTAMTAKWRRSSCDMCIPRFIFPLVDILTGNAMSALPPKADMCFAISDVADIEGSDALECVWGMRAVCAPEASIAGPIISEQTDRKIFGTKTPDLAFLWRLGAE